MNPGEIDAWLKLAGTIAGIAVFWWALGRKWWAARRKKVARRDEMFDGWPRMAEYLAGAKDREEKLALRESRTTQEFKAFSDHLTRQDKKLDKIVAQQWAQARLDPVAKFQCDHDGRNESVNLAYAQLMRVSEAELLRFGWKLRVVPADLRDYERDVAQAFREHRRYEGTVRMIRGDESMFRAHVRIEPHPEDPVDLSEGSKPTWFGAVLPVEELQ